MPGALDQITKTFKEKPAVAWGAGGAALGLATLLYRRSAAKRQQTPAAASTARPATVIQPAATADTTATDLQSWLSGQLAANNANLYAQLGQLLGSGGTTGQPVGPVGPVDGPRIPGIQPTPVPPASVTPVAPPPAAAAPANRPPVVANPAAPGSGPTQPSAPVSAAVVVGPPAPGTVWNPNVGWVDPANPSVPVQSPQQSWTYNP